MATKNTNKQGGHKGLHMSDAAKAKYAELFETALDTMEASEYEMPWVKPNRGLPMNYEHKKPFNGSNSFFLTLLCSIKGWEVPMFLTFDQITKMGLTLNIRTDKDGMPMFKDNGMPKFEQSFPVAKKLFTPYDKDGNKISYKDYDELTDEEKDECKKRWWDKFYDEYNLSQTDFAEKFPEKWETLTAIPPHEYKEGATDDVLEAMIMQGEWRCKIEFGGHECFYSPKEDHIRLPQRGKFKGDHAFYASALHEMAHSTAPDVKREVKGTFGSEDYAMEEFVAELTAACVCSMLGIGKLLDKNHIAYVQNWRTAIRGEKDFLPQVINEVQRATNFILTRYNEVAKKLHPLALPLAA